MTHLYDVFPVSGARSGKRVAVLAGADGDLQERAAAAGAPLTAFVQDVQPAGLTLRVFTPTREKGESDSATVAALVWAQERGLEGDFAEVGSGENTVTAQLCGGEWLLRQGVVSVREEGADLASRPLAPLHLPVAVHTASATRPNLVAELPTLAALDTFQPEAGSIAELNRQTGTGGLILYARQAPPEQPRADVSFRCFGPLRGFVEDPASSNMLACLTGVLNARGLLPPDSNLLRAAQRQPGRPASLTAQYGAPGEDVWVGGKAVETAG